MAEAWANTYAQASDSNTPLSFHSAGIEAHGLNPLAIQTMMQHGIDISGQRSDIIDEAVLKGMNLLVTVCGHADEKCPLLPPGLKKIHLPFDDPASARGSKEEIKICFDRVCLEIKAASEELVDQCLTEIIN